MKKTILVLFALLAVLLVFVACEHNHPENKFDPRSIPLTIEFYGMGGKVVFENAPSNLKYSISDGRIQQLGKDNDTISLGDAQKVSLYLTRPSSSVDNPLTISCEGSHCYVYGNVMSLYSESNYENMDYVHPFAFKGLFFKEQNKNIENHPEYDIYLPATKLKEHCYDEMFKNCTNLTRAPELPAMTLAESCYESMFEGCESLTVAPELPATKLPMCCYKKMFAFCYALKTAPSVIPAEEMDIYCCELMFAWCSSLTDAPKLPAKSVSNRGYDNMFHSCTSLEKAPELPAETLGLNCYYKMFSGCTSLKEAPELPAETISQGCYRGMFLGCTSLTKASDLPAKVAAGHCYLEMYKGCTSLTEPPVIALTEVDECCCEGMFEDCTSLKTGPVLKAARLIKATSYKYMFKGCSSLTSVTCLATEITTLSGLYPVIGWLDGVPANGTLYCAAGKTELWNRGYEPERRPESWTVEAQ